ncbi:MAG: glycosyltransferase [Candidatus Brocadiia bacterium]
MRRIFYLITELEIGGAEKALYELATRLDRRKFEPIVACLSGRGPLFGRLKEKGIEVIPIDMCGWWDLAAWVRLRRALRANRPHVLHTFLFHANFVGSLAAIRSGIGTRIASIRVEEPRLRHLWFEWLTQGLTDVYTCVSESARQYTHARAHVPMHKLVVIPNGVDPSDCDAPVLAPPPEWRLPEGAPVVAFVGRLDRQKNPLLLLRAAARVVREVPETVFAFAGTGRLEAQCRAEADRLGLSGSVRWLGWLSDTRPLLARMDLVALPSSWEGMPNVILEAMACGKPAVAANVGGCAELIVEGETGFLAPPGDEGALATCILRLLHDAGLRRRLGAAARERVEREFSIKAMVEKNEALYERNAVPF